jgi:hypothetical protein
MTHSHIVEFQGNNQLFDLHKTAFLCSRDIPASIVLKCYDWAIAQREAGNCVISGFHSVLEKDVLTYLLKGTQPVIVALARGMKARIEPEFKKPLEQGRLLIVTPFEQKHKRVTTRLALIRNAFMVELADEIVIGYAKLGGNIDRLIQQLGQSKPVHYL